MFGPFFFGFWWIVPLIAFAMCLAFLGFGVLGRGRGFMCMGGGHRSAPHDPAAERHA
jgi:hypothetical protein